MTDNQNEQGRENAQLGVMDLFVAFLVNPAEGADAIWERGRAWVPVLASIILASTLMVVYFGQVDADWLADFLIRASGQAMAPDQMEGFRKAMKPQNLQIGSTIGVIVGTLVMFLVVALYFHVVAQVRKMETTFGQWFAFAAWTSVPNLVALVLSIANVSIGDNSQLSLYQINPLSLSALLGLAEGENAKILSEIGLTNFWSWYVAVVAFARWSKASMATSSVIVLTPWVLYYGFKWLM